MQTTLAVQLIQSLLLLPLASACGAAVLDESSTKSAIATGASSNTSTLSDIIDLGYFKVEAETCVPSGSGQRSIAQWAAATRQLHNQDAAQLNFAWRQIQHYRADMSSNHHLCYYTVH